MHTAIDDRLLDRLQPLFSSDHQLAEGQNEIRLECDRVIFLRVVHVDIHRVDVVPALRADHNNLTAKSSDKRCIFCFRIGNDDIVIGHKKGIRNLTLCAERLAGSGCSEDQSVRVLQLLPVHHDQVVGECIQSVIKRLRFGLEQLLCRKWHENCRTAGCQLAVDRHQIPGKRQAAHQALFLPEVKPHQIAAVFLRNAGCLKYVIVQLLLIRAGI